MPIIHIFVIFLIFGLAISDLEKYAIKHTIAPHMAKRNAANIKMSATLSVLISNTLYPIFIHGNSDPQSIIVISGRTIFVSICLYFVSFCILLILPFLHFRRFLKSHELRKPFQLAEFYTPTVLFRRSQALATFFRSTLSAI